ncbi:unnamed protein product [Oppiella nova]|uniref:Uncharacterized protein n=1 Tax=Oppiella nova TaxID=334625 RepID=A0A7R9LH57_9ACAR|nr:unnamed protein product [Oppiella nova]CAG2163637.1 unnamed protein product [Oppiella nova]
MIEKNFSIVDYLVFGIFLSSSALIDRKKASNEEFLTGGKNLALFPIWCKCCANIRINWLPYLGVVLYGPALALASVTPLSVTGSILVVGIICTFYTSIGGIKAVIWTDVLQTILMFSGLLMVAIVGSIEMGGVLEPWKIAYDNNRLVIFNSEFSLYRGDTFWAVFMGTLTAWTGTYCVKQTQVQRYCCMSTPQKAKKL